MRFAGACLSALLTFYSPIICAAAPEGYQVTETVAPRDRCDGCVVEVLEDVFPGELTKMAAQRFKTSRPVGPAGPAEDLRLD